VKRLQKERLTGKLRQRTRFPGGLDYHKLGTTLNTSRIVPTEGTIKEIRMFAAPICLTTSV